MIKFFIVNIKESEHRLEGCIDALVENRVPIEAIEVVHPMMVRDCPSQDDWCEATGIEAFQSLKGLPPLLVLSFVHTYVRCLEKIMAFENKDDIGIVLEDDFALNTDFENVKDYLDIAFADSMEKGFFAQLYAWKFPLDPDIDESIRLEGTPFYRKVLCGTQVLAFNKIAAKALRDKILALAPTMYRERGAFYLDVYLGEDGMDIGLGDTYTVKSDADVFFEKNSELARESEYLNEGGELLARNIYKMQQMEVISHPKRFGRDLPVYEMPRPKSLDCGQGCIIYSLFIGDDTEPESDYHRYLINSAFWSSHAWRANTNLENKLWGIFFHVERRLYEQPAVREQFERANLTDFVVLFDPPDFQIATRRKTGQRLYATLCPKFDRYKRAYICDADLFICRRDNSPKIGLEDLWDIGEDQSLFNVLQANPVPYFRLQRPPYHLDKPDAEAKLKGYLEDYLGEPLHRGYKMLSGIMAWNPQKLREDFKEMVVTLTPSVCHEENQFAIYCVKTDTINKPLKNIWDIPLTGNFYENFMVPTTPDHFFEHAIIEPDDPNFDREAWIRKWYEHIGIYRGQ